MRWPSHRMTWAAVAAALAMAASLATPVHAADQVVLGAVLPLTGSSATVGEDQRRGIELAVDYINSRGGVLGKPLKVIVEIQAAARPRRSMPPRSWSRSTKCR